MNINYKDYRFTAIIKHDEDGYFAYVPGLQGCHAQGETMEETMANLKDVTKLIITDMISRGEGIPQSKSTFITFISIEA